jgi:signal transduction histidine kinase/CheY-like chemotaxis protein
LRPNVVPTFPSFAPDRGVRIAAALALLAIAADIGVVAWRSANEPSLQSIPPVERPARIVTPDGAVRDATVRFPGRLPPGVLDDGATLYVDVPVEVSAEAAGTEWAVVIDRPIFDVTATWDGAAMSADAHAPGRRAVFRIPGEAVHAGVHTVQIATRGAWGLGGAAGDLLVGPADTARARVFRADMQTAAVVGIALVAACAAVAVAAFRPRRVEFLWSGLLWAAVGAVLFLRSDAWALAFDDPDTLLRAHDSAAIAATLFGLLFSRRAAGLPWGRAAPVLWAFVGLYVAFVASPWRGIFAWGPGAALLTTLSVAGLNAAWHARAARAGDRGAQLLLASSALPLVWSAMEGRIAPHDVDAMIIPALGAITVAVAATLFVRHGDLTDRYERLVHEARDAVVVVSRDGAVREANPAGRRILGLGERSGDLREAIDPETERLLLQHLASGEDGRRVELRTRAAASGRGAVVESVAVDLDADTALLVVRDLRARHAAERGLLHAARLETVGLLAAGLAHDVNNALAALLLQLENVRAEAPPVVAARIEQLGAVVVRIGKLNRRLASVVRGNAARREPQSVPAVLLDTVEWARRIVRRDVHIELSAPEDLPPVIATRVELEQVVINLLTNAGEASPPEGRVRVTAGLEGGTIAVVVEDEGPGVAPELRARVWEPFYTTRTEGSGVGLAVVARVVRDLGGSYAVADAIGGRGGPGARFEIRLPAEGLRSDGPTATRPRVLLVDDDHDVRATMRAILTERGFEVTDTADPHAALAMIRPPSEAPDGRFALLVTDLSMPRLDGQALARAATARAPDLRVLLVSALPADAVAVRWPCLSKPFGAEELVTAARGVLMEG